MASNNDYASHLKKQKRDKIEKISIEFYKAMLSNPEVTKLVSSTSDLSNMMKRSISLAKVLIKEIEQEEV